MKENWQDFYEKKKKKRVSRSKRGTRGSLLFIYLYAGNRESGIELGAGGGGGLLDQNWGIGDPLRV